MHIASMPKQKNFVTLRFPRKVAWPSWLTLWYINDYSFDILWNSIYWILFNWHASGLIIGEQRNSELILPIYALRIC